MINLRLLIHKAKFSVGKNSRFRAFSVKSGVFGDGGDDEGNDNWGKPSPNPEGHGLNIGSEGFEIGSWSTGLTKEHFDGVNHQQQASSGQEARVQSKSMGSQKLAQNPGLEELDEKLKELVDANRKGKAYIDKWGERLQATGVLLNQAREPGVRGSYLKDSEKAEMYRLHKEDPEVYTVERLASDYRIMRQRVHAVLWLKELEAERERKLGEPLDASVDLLLDQFPEFFNSHDREFHVAALPYKPDFKVMPEGWDGTIRDKDEVHYEISKKEDDMLYRDFVLRMNFSKKMMSGEVKGHKYSRRRSEQGWNITVEKLGAKGKRGDGGGWKFVSLPDGSSRPLNDMEKLYVKRETPRRRRKFLSPNAVHSSIVK